MINKSAIMRSAMFGVLLGVGTGQAAAELPANVMAQFNQLSPAQQEAVAAQYGVDINSIRSQSSSSAVESSMPKTLTQRTTDPNAPSQRPAFDTQRSGQQPVDSPSSGNSSRSWSAARCSASRRTWSMSTSS